MPKISFLVPVYNVEKYIDQCITSILNQTFRDFELILVDDGSPDNCPSICDKYAERDARVKVIHKRNAGVSEARNSGIEVATGEWAYFVDSDDWIEADAAATLYNDAIQTGADCVMSDCVTRYNDGRILRRNQFSKVFYTEDPEEIKGIQKNMLCHKFNPYYSSNCDNGYAAPWGKFVKMSIIKENDIRFDPYAKGVFDDGVYSLYLLDHVKKFYYNGRHTYDYRVVDSSLTHAFKKNALDIARRNCELVAKFINETGKDDSFWQAEYCRRVSFFASYLSKYFYNPENPMKSGEVKKEILKVLNGDLFRPAFQNAESKNLPYKHAFVLFCGKHRHIWGLKLYSTLKLKFKRNGCMKW